MIEVSISKQLGDLSLDIEWRQPAGGITAVFGRSGAGKTSFINAISGLHTPDSGRVEINGKLLFDSDSGVNTAVEKRRIGYVFQDARLFPHYSVLGNLNYGRVKPYDQEQFDRIVSLLDLSSLLGRRPVQLSGGEKQRVAIGRALLSSPELLIMDEPLASLDMPRKREVMPYLERLSRELSIPILYVTHSLSEILRLADNMLVIDRGRLVCQGTLEEVWQSKVMRPWQSFSDQSTVFEAHIDHHHPDYALTCLSIGEGKHLWVQQVSGSKGSQVRIQVRSNDVSVALEKPAATSIRNVIPVKIVNMESREPAKERQSVSLELEISPGRTLWANVTQWAVDDLGLKAGLSVYALIKGVSVTQKDMVAVQGHDL